MRQWPAVIVTVSDGVSEGTREDSSGHALEEFLAPRGFNPITRYQIPDGVESVRDCLVGIADGFAGLIVTTGGTGFGPRDLTPEGTTAVLERPAPGLAEAMRLANPNGLGRLSRAVAGVRGRALIVNTPGSRNGAIETIEAIIDVVPHALELLLGERPH